MSFHEDLSLRVEKVNKLLESVMKVDTGLSEYLMEAMRYSVYGTGKRLRPILMEASAELFRGDAPELPYFMAAIELIHSYSLVHDDMPCIDNDEYRRGRKTTHAVYGETTALLAGDGLLNFAYETAAAAFNDTKDPVKTANALKILARKAGIFGMVGGQAVDVHCEKNNDPLTQEKLLYIHENKTAALIEAAMMIGAVLGGASQTDVKKMEEAASAIGIAFQIRDDILDVVGTFEELGKPIGSDADNDKDTYVTLFGFDKAKEDVQMYSDKALSIIESFGGDKEFLLKLVESLISRNK
ncbi:MAG: polyprenyl synthetase family protein [Lachnospiraceae bacterium]|nr:polyprenyl synthetase family protein [Lachnospiraceae bacterium]MBR5993164.1 polyprenyl synthetase family protein [Lachnospiraceae bacterium]